jgi:hypothetical protein
VGHRAEDGRDGDAEAGGYQLTRELTLQEIGKEISAAILTLSWAKKMDVAAALLENLRKPVGKLGRNN